MAIAAAIDAVLVFVVIGLIALIRRTTAESRPLRWVTVMGYCLPPRVERFVERRRVIPAQ